MNLSAIQKSVREDGAQYVPKMDPTSPQANRLRKLGMKVFGSGRGSVVCNKHALVVPQELGMGAVLDRADMRRMHIRAAEPVMEVAGCVRGGHGSVLRPWRNPYGRVLA